MTTAPYTMPWHDTLGETLGHARRVLAEMLSGRDQPPRPAGVLYEDVASLPDHLLRDIGIEPHQLGSLAGEYRTQVDARGFRQSAFTVDAHDIRALMAGTGAARIG